MKDLSYQVSICECSHLIVSLKDRDLSDAACHTNTIKLVRARIKEEKVEKVNQNTRRDVNYTIRGKRGQGHS